jgi:hypothetical protein
VRSRATTAQCGARPRARFINQSGYDVTYKSDRAGLWAARIAISRLASSFNFFCAVSNNLAFALASTKPSHVCLPAARPFPHATSLPAVLLGVDRMGD